MSADAEGCSINYSNDKRVIQQRREKNHLKPSQQRPSLLPPDMQNITCSAPHLVGYPPRSQKQHAMSQHGKVSLRGQPRAKTSANALDRTLEWCYEAEWNWRCWKSELNHMCIYLYWIYNIISGFASVSMTLLTPKKKNIHASMELIQKLIGEHDRIPYLRMSWLSTNVRTAQRLDRQPGPAQDTKLHLLPPKAAVANLKRFVRRHRKSEVSWGRTQQLSSCRTGFDNTLPPFASQRQLKDSQCTQEYTRHVFWVLWAAWSAGERSPITYFCSEVKKWGCSLPNQKEAWKCGTGSKMKQMVKYIDQMDSHFWLTKLNLV